jgi:hypothetical protein
MFRKVLTVGFSAIVLSTLAVSAHAINLITNPGFETAGANGQVGWNTTLSGWTNGMISASLPGYNFLYHSGTADTTGAVGHDGTVDLWGPSDGSANGLPASSPNGGNYLALDSNFEAASISQTVGGLTVGAKYILSFYWAGAQQAGFDGATTDKMQVTFGSDVQTTSVLNVANHGFTGWNLQSFTFTASSTSELLSFLAIGTPANGAPPFALLDGISLSQVPEPGAFGLVLSGLIGGLGALKLKKRMKG